MKSSRVDSADKLFASGCFGSKKSLASYLILDELAQKDTPLGSAKLKVALQAKGLQMSEANIGRYLMDLDIKGYTVIQKTQGRFLTQEGRDYISSKKKQIFERTLQKEYLKSIELETLDDLVQLLKLRRLLETEAAALAAKHATSDDEESMEQNIKDHKVAVEIDSAVSPLGLDFHYKLAAASKNKLLASLISILLGAEAAAEAKENELSSREMGIQYHQEHVRIFNAVFKEKDVDKAVQETYDHITVLIKNVEETRNKKFFSQTSPHQ